MATPLSENPQTIPFATASGRPVVFLDPSRTEVVAYDLYTSLRLARRYHGHLDWTVLQHTVLCILLARDMDYSKEELVYVAVHDMHEGYVGEVVTQLKQVIPQFADLEQIWELWVHSQLGMEVPSGDLLAAVKKVDYRALVPEMTYSSYSLTDVAGEGNGGPATEREMALVASVRACSDLALWELVASTVEAAGFSIPGDVVPPADPKRVLIQVGRTVGKSAALPGLPLDFLKEVGFPGTSVDAENTDFVGDKVFVPASDYEDLESWQKAAYGSQEDSNEPS